MGRASTHRTMIGLPWAVLVSVFWRSPTVALARAFATNLRD